jgi:hypothetical protein
MGYTLAMRGNNLLLQEKLQQFIQRQQKLFVETKTDIVNRKLFAKMTQNFKQYMKVAAY